MRRKIIITSHKYCSYADYVGSRSFNDLLDTLSRYKKQITWKRWATSCWAWRETIFKLGTHCCKAKLKFLWVSLHWTVDTFVCVANYAKYLHITNVNTETWNYWCRKCGILQHVIVKVTLILLSGIHLQLNEWQDCMTRLEKWHLFCRSSWTKLFKWGKCPLKRIT